MNTALATLSLLVSTAVQPRVAILWPGGAPGAKGNQKEDRPFLHVYLPAPNTAVGTAVVICPGGSYYHHAIAHEGREPAEWLARQGVAAFVLRYRLAPQYSHPAPMRDLQRAIRLVRARSAEWGVDPHRVGVWGFSAGGHLASTVATHFDAGDRNARDSVEHFGCRPDFAILCYPVITFMPPYAQMGSRKNLIGDQPDSRLLDSLSNETRVTQQTPPTFLFHTGTDEVVPVENSILYYLALRRAGVPAELHVYEQGRHGVGLALSDPELGSWSARLADWLKRRNLLTRRN